MSCLLRHKIVRFMRGQYSTRFNYGVAAVETGGKQMPTGHPHLDGFESQPQRKELLIR